MKIAIYPGSFDPPTNGHLDIAKRASSLFDRLIVCVANNPEKKTLFSIEERVEMMRKSVENISNIEVISTSDLIVNEAKRRNAVAIIRGLRAVTDFEFEFQLAAGNEYIAPEIDRVFFMSSPEKSFISSSSVKEFASHHIDVSSLVPEVVNSALINKYK